MEETMLNNKIYLNLIYQFERLFRHNRQGSFRTKHRYAEAYKRFLAFLAEVYRLEKIANVAPKHVYAYTDKLVQTGKSAAYIKTDLASIRFWHDKLSNPRFKHLPSNKDLNLARRKYGGVDRTWSHREFNMGIVRATALGREDYVTILCLARYAALRLHECFRIDTQTATVALKTGKLQIKGKGGLERDVPINLTIEIQLKKMLAITPRGHKLFVAPDDKTHLAMHRFQNFISRYRSDIQDIDSTRPLHFHGLRHTRAAEWYEEFMTQGMSEKQARLAVAKLLGHGRDDVAKVYLASLQTGGDADGC